jgi:hypothetical protein
VGCRVEISAGKPYILPADFGGIPQCVQANVRKVVLSVLWTLYYTSLQIHLLSAVLPFDDTYFELHLTASLNKPQINKYNPLLVKRIYSYRCCCYAPSHDSPLFSNLHTFQLNPPKFVCPFFRSFLDIAHDHFKFSIIKHTYRTLPYYANLHFATHTALLHFDYSCKK